MYRTWSTSYGILWGVIYVNLPRISGTDVHIRMFLLCHLLLEGTRKLASVSLAGFKVLVSYKLRGCMVVKCFAVLKPSGADTEIFCAAGTMPWLLIPWLLVRSSGIILRAFFTKITISFIQIFQGHWANELKNIQIYFYVQMIAAWQGLTHWGRDKMAAISQTTSSSAFSWMKMFEFWLKFQWCLFLRVQLTLFQHWFR